MKKWLANIRWISSILLGSAIFALAFDMFLVNHGLNSGGVSGLAMVFVKMTGMGSVGLVSAVLNLPLFLLSRFRIGRRFCLGSIVGMLASSALIDILAAVPAPEVDPLLAAIYGGVLAGLGLGIVFAAGASTGGSDIIVRMLKKRMREVPIGTISTAFDLTVGVLTAIAFADVTKGLYSGVVVFITGQIIDAVVYRFDYSKVAWIISPEYEKIAKMITVRLDRGATFLDGEGVYSRRGTKVILTAVKKQQIAMLKQLVAEIDPDAFIIVQEAHQVLGDGFSRYSGDNL